MSIARLRATEGAGPRWGAVLGRSRGTASSRTGRAAAEKATTLEFGQYTAALASPGGVLCDAQGDLRPVLRHADIFALHGGLHERHAADHGREKILRHVGSVSEVPTASRASCTRLTSCNWIEAQEFSLWSYQRQGSGRASWNGLGNATCRRLFTVRYARLADAMDDPNRCRAAGDGGCYERIGLCKQVQPLIVGDFNGHPNRDPQRRRPVRNHGSARGDEQPPASPRISSQTNST